MARKLGLSISLIYFFSLFLTILSSITSNEVQEDSGSLNNNKVLSFLPPNYKEGFPRRVVLKPGKREHLQGKVKRKPHSQHHDVVVAKDVSGNYTTIQQALDAAARRKGKGRFEIHIKEGTYKEYLKIGQHLGKISLIGDGLTKTIITGDRSAKGGFQSFDSATVTVEGNWFKARGITFQNTAGPDKEQAVALRSSSQHSVFHQCAFDGYQDTLYVHQGLQFYKECTISGTVDFIFGNAAAVLQNCNIYVKKPGVNQHYNTITASSRTTPYDRTGIVIHNSAVLPTPELKKAFPSIKTYLGRPWRPFARTVFLQTYLDPFVDPAGWIEWEGPRGLKTSFFGEYMNKGLGASTNRRVKWPAYHVLSKEVALNFTVANFISGDKWLPATGVRYSGGL